MDFLQLDRLTARHASYDKPSNKHLQDIGIIEYFWQAFFEQVLAQQDWELAAVDLNNIIQERCVNNFERRYTLKLLEETVLQLQRSDNDSERLLILLEGIKDWSRKSVVRGEDIQ